MVAETKSPVPTILIPKNPYEDDPYDFNTQINASGRGPHVSSGHLSLRDKNIVFQTRQSVDQIMDSSRSKNA